MTTNTVRNMAHAWVWSVKAAKRFRGPRLKIASGTREALVRAKTPAPAGATIVSATLYLYQDGAFAGSVTLSGQPAATGWDQTEVTWNTKPASTGTTTTVTKNNPADGTEWALDVTAAYSAIAGGLANRGLRLTSNHASVLKFYSPEAEKLRPRLVVVWSVPPEKPDTLIPSGFVSKAKPVVSCDYTDHNGVTEVTSMQVQVDPDNDFTVAAYDTGEQAVSVPEIDLNTVAPAYGGVANGATTWWRCRVKGTDGIWSPWADSVSFTRSDKPALTITSPAAAPNNTVSEFTPPITWTFPGQTHYQVLLARAVDGVVVYNSGIKPSASGSHTIPAGNLVDGVTFRVIVRCWDDVDREDNTADPTYVEATRDFTVAYSAAVTAPVSLEVTQPRLDGQPAPWADIVVVRATQPDTWTVVRDGAAIVTDSETGDFFTVDPDGITYRGRDVTGRLEVPHTYKVRAEVNGALSSGGPTGEITLQSEGVWLIDPKVGGKAVIIGDRDIIDSDQAEEGTTYRPLGGGNVVRVVHGINGLSGAVQGGMIRDRFDDDAYTWAAMEETLNEFKARPADTFRLVWADLNIPVVIGDIKVDPHPRTMRGRVLKRVAFRWWQNGEFPFDSDGVW